MITLLCEEPSPFICLQHLSVELQVNSYVKKRQQLICNALQYTTLGTVVLSLAFVMLLGQKHASGIFFYVLMWFFLVLVNCLLIGALRILLEKWFSNFTPRGWNYSCRFSEVKGKLLWWMWEYKCNGTWEPWEVNGKPLCRTIEIYFHCSYIMLID